MSFHQSSSPPEDRASRRARTRRGATLAAGWTLLVVGGALLVLPGPGIPLVLGGLALLEREVAWAGRARQYVEAKVFRNRPARTVVLREGSERD